MAKVYDVPANELIDRLATALRAEDIPAPSWIPFVKTGAHADKPPQKQRLVAYKMCFNYEENLP